MTAPTNTPSVEEDAKFGSEELLYRRYQSQYWVGGKFTGVGLRFPNPSFNRSKYSDPSDVLTDGSDSFLEWGVVSCKVKDIPTGIVSGTGVTFDFFPRYEPRGHNLAHSVIAHKPQTDQKPPLAVRRKARTELGRKMKIQIVARV